MCDTCDYIAATVRLDLMREDEVFDALDQLVSQGKLVSLGEVDPSSPRYAVVYRCSACRAMWTFTVPDHAFKGGLIRTA